MRWKIRSFPVFCALLIPLGGSLSGCSQPDNPTPVTAPPPPPPQAEELKVPKKGPGGKAYGGGDRYKKSMNFGNDSDTQ